MFLYFLYHLEVFLIHQFLKEKHKKKSKRKKSRKRDTSSSESDSDSGGEEQWVEKPGMTFHFFFIIILSNLIRLSNVF